MLKSQPALHILQTCFSQSWGGLEIQALEVSRQLQKRGHQVWLACYPGSRLQHEAAQEDIHTVPFAVRGYFHPVLAWRIGRFLRQKDIHLIHCQLSRDLSTIVPAMKLSFRNIPVVLSKRVGSYLSKRDPLHRFTYANVRYVLAISEVIRRNVIETTTMPPEKVLTLHDAIDAVAYSRTHAGPGTLRTELHLPDDCIVVGFVGRFSPGKGHEELLEAAALIHAQRPDVRFVIVGEASFGEQSYAQKIRNMCRTLGLDETVLFTGFRKDIPNVMMAFDVLAFPSHAESFGVVLIEAMAMELPVVSTNCDGVVDIVVDGQTGLYVPPRNGKKLAEALLTLINDAALRQRMGAAGRRRVEDLFDQQHQIDRLETLYRGLVRQA